MVWLFKGSGRRLQMDQVAHAPERRPASSSDVVQGNPTMRLRVTQPVGKICVFPSIYEALH